MPRWARLCRTRLAATARFLFPLAARPISFSSSGSRNVVHHSVTCAARVETVLAGWVVAGGWVSVNCGLTFDSGDL